MSKKFVKVQKIVVPMLTAIILCMQASPAFAVSEEEFVYAATSNQQVEIVANTYAGAPLVANADHGGTPATWWGTEVRTGAVKDGCISFTDAQANGGKLDLSSVSTAGFVDWDTSQWWASRDSVKYAIGMGYVNGRKTADGTALCANDPVTKNEFAAVLVRMTVKPEVIEECRQEALKEWAAYMGLDASNPDTEKQFKDTEHWAYTAGYIRAAVKTGIVGPVDLGKGKDGDAPCDRVTMARYIYNACYARGEEQMSINKDAATKVFADANSMASYERQYAGWAAGKGLIGGDNASKFNPKDTMNRASMCEVIYRMDNPVAKDGTTPREKLINQLYGGASGVPQDSVYGEGGIGADDNKTLTEVSDQNLEPITIDMRNPGRHRCPYPGDTVIRPDGTSVVLKFDETYGILGWGQNCDPWTGTISIDDTSVSMVLGELGGGTSLGATIYQDYYNNLAMDSLFRAKMTGGEWETHWTFEYEAVRKAKEAERDAVDGAIPKYDGQVSADGYWIAKKTIVGTVWMYRELDRSGL